MILMIIYCLTEVGTLMNAVCAEVLGPVKNRPVAQLVLVQFGQSQQNRPMVLVQLVLVRLAQGRKCHLQDARGSGGQRVGRGSKLLWRSLLQDMGRFHQPKLVLERFGPSPAPEPTRSLRRTRAERLRCSVAVGSPRKSNTASSSVMTEQPGPLGRARTTMWQPPHAAWTGRSRWIRADGLIAV